MSAKQDEKGKKLLSIKTVSERLEMSRSYVYYLFTIGLPSVKIGTSRRIFEHELDQFMEGLRITNGE